MEELSVGTRVDHPRYGEGIVSKNNLTAYEIFFERGGKVEITKRNTDLTVLQKNENAPKSGISVKELEKVITYVLDQYGALSEIVPLGDKWIGGKIIFQPAN